MATTIKSVSRLAAGRPTPVLALASAILGLVGLILSFLPLGAVFAFAGVIFGCVHLLRHDTARDMAYAGTCIALAALVSCVVFAGAHRQIALHPAERSQPSIESSVPQLTLRLM